MLAEFFRQYLYVQLSPQWLTVRDPAKREEISEIPEIAIRTDPGKRASVVAFGAAARSTAAEPNTKVHNPFAHPRSLISDFILAESLLKAFVRRVRGNAVLCLNPVFVMHPLGDHAGGLTQVELRAMRELALGAGASGVHLWQGPVLTDEQVMQEQFPSTGRVFK